MIPYSKLRPTTRVAMNTGLLYGKMIIKILISLYSTRLVLNALGAKDYGIFNLVGGVIGLLAFLNGAMSISTQRYMSYSLGEGDNNKLKSVFSTSVFLHLVIGAIVVMLLELVGIFIFNGFLNIPADRIGTAKIVFHFMVISTFFTINAVPYDAVIGSHENFLFDSIVGIFESLMKLIIAISLLSFGGDKLIFYSLLIALLTIFIRFIKSYYCFKNYEESRVRKISIVDLKLTKEMMSFAGWNLFGSFCTIARNQGLAVVLNLFFGVIINAAYAVATQVRSNLMLFSVNMLKSLNPQIVKSEGNNDRHRMLKLTAIACKLSFFLLLFFAIPIIMDMPFLLNIWLKEVPANTIIFCRLIIVLSLLQLLTYPLGTAIQAVGKIKMFQTIVGSLLILNLPVDYYLLKIGFPAYSVFGVAIFLELIAGTSRIYFAYKIADLSVNFYLKKVLVSSIITTILIVLLSFVPHILVEEGTIRFLIMGCISSISFLFLVRFIALTNYEINIIREILRAFLKKTKSILKISRAG